MKLKKIFLLSFCGLLLTTGSVLYTNNKTNHKTVIKSINDEVEFDWSWKVKNQLNDGNHILNKDDCILINFSYKTDFALESLKLIFDDNKLDLVGFENDYLKVTEINNERKTILLTVKDYFNVLNNSKRFFKLNFENDTKLGTEKNLRVYKLADKNSINLVSSFKDDTLLFPEELVKFAFLTPWFTNFDLNKLVIEFSKNEYSKFFEKQKTKNNNEIIYKLKHDYREKNDDVSITFKCEEFKFGESDTKTIPIKLANNPKNKMLINFDQQTDLNHVFTKKDEKITIDSFEFEDFKQNLKASSINANNIKFHFFDEEYNLIKNGSKNNNYFNWNVVDEKKVEIVFKDLDLIENKLDAINLNLLYLNESEIVCMSTIKIWLKTVEANYMPLVLTTATFSLLTVCLGVYIHINIRKNKNN